MKNYVVCLLFTVVARNGPKPVKEIKVFLTWLNPPIHVLLFLIVCVTFITYGSPKTNSTLNISAGFISDVFGKLQTTTCTHTICDYNKHYLEFSIYNEAK